MFTFVPVVMVVLLARMTIFTATLKIYRGSYTNVLVLLTLFNELRKWYKLQGLASILSLLCNEFNKFNKLYMSTNVRFY